VQLPAEFGDRNVAESWSIFHLQPEFD
jgi:hypothetical protein